VDGDGDDTCDAPDVSAPLGEWVFFCNRVLSFWYFWGYMIYDMSLCRFADRLYKRRVHMFATKYMKDKCQSDQIWAKVKEARAAKEAQLESRAPELLSRAERVLHAFRRKHVHTSRDPLHVLILGAWLRPVINHIPPKIPKTQNTVTK
jgi:hypothetical protein